MTLERPETVQSLSLSADGLAVPAREVRRLGRCGPQARWQPQIQAAIDELRSEIARCLREEDEGDGVLVLTDMFGGTPSNLAISVMEKAPVEVIAGVNLPMLIKLTSVREEMGLAEAVASAQKAGCKYINVASGLLGEEKA